MNPSYKNRKKSQVQKYNFMSSNSSKTIFKHFIFIFENYVLFVSKTKIFKLKKYINDIIDGTWIMSSLILMMMDHLIMF